MSKQVLESDLHGSPRERRLLRVDFPEEMNSLVEVTDGICPKFRQSSAIKSLIMKCIDSLAVGGVCSDPVFG